MNKNVLKIILIIAIMSVIIIGTMYLIDMNRMKKGEKVAFSSWGTQYIPTLKINQNENISNYANYKKYFKAIDNLKIELDIPSEWKYEEMMKNKEDDFYKYAIKLYKNNEEQCAILYIYSDQHRFGVCGTGRTDETITLNNGKRASIGYYDENKEWSDISFYDINGMIAIMNHGLKNTDAEEVIEFIKTINIIEEK